MEMWTLFAEIWASYQTRNTPTPKDIDVIKFSLAWRMPRPVISIGLLVMALLALNLIALTAIALSLYFVFRVCNDRTFTHSTGEAFCPGVGPVIEADI